MLLKFICLHAYSSVCECQGVSGNIIMFNDGNRREFNDSRSVILLVNGSFSAFKVGMK